VRLHCAVWKLTTSHEKGLALLVAEVRADAPHVPVGVQPLRRAPGLADGVADPAPSTFTADAVASYLGDLEAQGRSKATVRKERAALNRLARHLLLIGAIEQRVALEILDVEASTMTGRPRQRPALDEITWRRVKDRAAARVLELIATGRASAPTATRDLAIIVCLGELGLRSEELRILRLENLSGLRSGSATPWLHVVGQGSRERGLPLP
jgi:integrase